MENYKQHIASLLAITARQSASDLHIAVGKKPTIRIDGTLVPLEAEPIITPEMSEGLLTALLSPDQLYRLKTNKELDFSFTHEGDNSRFRANVFYQKSFMAGAFRLIPARIRTIEELSLPNMLHDVAKLSQGFVLVVGPAGHGKSTTLAAIVDEINHSRTDHIITIEDPIEYQFTQDRSVISQREVGTDTLSFPNGLRAVLRQDPDVIMLGEMRDADSIMTAMTAAETGHLVLSTLHTNSASQTIDRIIDSFPANQQSQAVSQLSATLIAIVSQRLIPKIGGGRVPANEIMLVNSAIRNLIRERKTYQIDVVIETNAQEGMLTLNRSLVNLVSQGLITTENAELHSLNPAELRLLLQKHS
jgi:twitching motility protein PilT